MFAIRSENQMFGVFSINTQPYYREELTFLAPRSISPVFKSPADNEKSPGFDTRLWNVTHFK